MSLDGNPAVLSLRTLFWSQCFERSRRHFDGLVRKYFTTYPLQIEFKVYCLNKNVIQT